MLGKPVPDFSLAATGGTIFRLSFLRGTKLVLYFYPKDNTPGCIAEGRDFRDLHAQFRRAGAKKMRYCKKARGIERSTFVVDEKRVLAREWRGVKVPRHAQEVLSFVKAL
jgi:peroxiredoxin Q/BCP